MSVILLTGVLRIAFLIASMVAMVLAIIALIKGDWIQACAWLLLDISCTLAFRSEAKP